jgi:hypothetical protein
MPALGFSALRGPVRRIGANAVATFNNCGLPPQGTLARAALRAEAAARAAAHAISSTAVSAPAPAVFKLGQGLRLVAPPAGQGSRSSRSIVAKSFSSTSSNSNSGSRTPEGLGFGHVLRAVASAAGLVPALTTCLLVATRYSSRAPAGFRRGRVLCVVASASTGSEDSRKGMAPYEFRILDGRCQVWRTALSNNLFAKCFAVKSCLDHMPC